MRPARCGGRSKRTALEPDGQAAACKAVEVGSTPTGVSDRSTAGSDYIFLQRSPKSEPILRWMVFKEAQLPVGTTSLTLIGAERRDVSTTTSLGLLTTQTTLPNCLLGVHDGPKVAMPGDRLVNGAGVSR